MTVSPTKEKSTPPFFLFLSDLREAGLQVDVETALLFLKVIGNDEFCPEGSVRGCLERLCSLLWCKNTADKEKYQPALDRWQESVAEIKEKVRQTITQSPDTPVTEPKMEEKEVSESTTKSLIKEIVSLDELEPLEKEEESRQQQHIEWVTTGSDLELSSTLIVPSRNDPQPVTRSMMQKSLRAVRTQRYRTGKKVIHIKITVTRAAQDGFFLHPVFIPHTLCGERLVFMLDYGGSMAPFHPLLRSLCMAVRQDEILNHITDITYFHNIPGNYLYHDPGRQSAEPLEQVLKRVQNTGSAIFIVSDAGAARGRQLKARSKLTNDFLKRVFDYTRKCVWMNPVPEHRWWATSAEEIYKRLPSMVDMNSPETWKSRLIR